MSLAVRNDAFSDQKRIDHVLAMFFDSLSVRVDCCVNPRNTALLTTIFEVIVVPFSIFGEATVILSYLSISFLFIVEKVF